MIAVASEHANMCIILLFVHVEHEINTRQELASNFNNGIPYINRILSKKGSHFLPTQILIWDLTSC